MLHCTGHTSMKIISVSCSLTLAVLVTTALLFGISYAQLDSRSFGGFSDQPQPLAMEKAFPFYVSAVSPGQFKIVWNLAEGHYLYRHAFDFSMIQKPEGQALDVDYVLPDGLKKNDQFFGDIEAYYGQIEVDINLRTIPGPDAILLISYQGCADWGFCYPPQRFEFLLNP